LYISKIEIENFRLFGSGARAFTLALNPGLTALVGENDAGKTAVIDAVRLVLGTRDQELLRIDTTDFHQPTGGQSRADQILIRLHFRELTLADRGAFAEYLTYETLSGEVDTTLIVTWVVKRNTKDNSSRRTLPAEWRTGANGDGPLLDFGARSLLTATYLRPLRDAERAMSAGRGSRLSQILQHAKEIKSTGVGFNSTINPDPDPKTLSVLGLGDYASFLFGENEGIKSARNRLNDEYLEPLSFANDLLKARIGVSGAQDDALRLRQLLEKLELVLTGATDAASIHGRGLGSNNLLFMACELLLLATESDGFPLLLIEEPEAHLHPQRQVRLMSFLQAQAAQRRPDGQQIQIIVTTHSPNLASELTLGNLALIQGARGFPLGEGHTQLSKNDYRFLERFLDVTKANLFFARAVLIVEGDAENILVPAIARLLGRDFRRYGVSVVNVGGVGLGRYARIFLRKNPLSDGEINIPVACVADMDVMPNNAPWIVGKLAEGKAIPVRPPSRRKWRVKQDFPGPALEELRQSKREKASGQKVETFVADEWTLEFDLAYFGLEKLVWCAATLALNEGAIQDGTKTKANVLHDADQEFKVLATKELDRATLAACIYARFASEGASKAIGAQYLAELLETTVNAATLSPEDLRKLLPPYLVGAIAHVTEPFSPAVATASTPAGVDDGAAPVAAKAT
jgi:putative ATP-dependent endonuclease of OLD family